MTASRRFRRLAALAVALALLTTAALSVMAQAESSQFTLIEGVESGSALSPREIAAKCRTSVVAIETETRVVQNGYNGYSPFDMFGYGYGYG